MLNEQERREHPRLGVSFKVFEPGGELIGSTKNLSLKGCFIETKQTIKKSITLTFQLPDSLEKVNAPCEVLWENGEGMGIGFDLTDKNKLHFLRFFWMGKND